MDLLDTLYVSTPGTTLHLEGDAVRARHPDTPGRRIVPLLRLESMVLWRGVDVSPDLLHRCLALGIHVTWITQNGRLVASVTGDEPGRPDLRVAQFQAHGDPEWRLALARRFTAGKIQNYRQLLLRAAQDADGERREALRSVAKTHAEAAALAEGSTNIAVCMGAEGMAARAYFGHLDLLVSGAVNLRSRRPPRDRINCYLSALYGLLRSSVHAAVVHTGLDPYIGFLHATRSARPALALDLMEELRPLLADRLVASLFNRQQIKPSFTRELPGGAVLLTDEGWKHLLRAWSESRRREWSHSGLGRNVPAAQLPIIQARLLARHLREPVVGYAPWRPQS